MSLQWTLVATFLYAEVAVALLLMIPWISAYRWRKIFKSRILRCLEAQAHIYFTVFLGVLALLFCDALREIWHYSQQKETTKVGTDLDHEMQNSMKLFRAQRNLYISGFALFLWLIIRRLVTLLTDLANARVGADAAMKQAASASEAAKRFMESRDVKDDNAKNVDLEELKEMKEKLAAAEKEAERSGKNLEAMKSQSESLKNEYDRLLGEYEKLEKKLETVRGSGDSSKKDE